MGHYRLVVTSSGGAVAWDSGKVPADHAVGVVFGVALRSGTYSVTATWWDSKGAGPSPSTSASFDVGPSATDWAGATEWLGRTQGTCV